MQNDSTARARSAHYHMANFNRPGGRSFEEHSEGNSAKRGLVTGGRFHADGFVGDVSNAALHAVVDGDERG